MEEINSKDIWHYAIECTGDGVWDLNLKTNKVFYSLEWKEMFGYIGVEIENTIDTWRDRIYPDDTERILENFNKFIKNEIDYYTNEYRAVTKDEHIIWILERGKIVERNDEGIPQRVIVAQTDITKQRIAMEVSEEAKILKNRFLNNMSHEIRTPMNGVIGFLELLHNTELDEEQTEYVKDAKEAANNLIIIIDDIFEYSNLENGKVILAKTFFDIRAIIEECIMTVTPKAKEKALEIEYYISKEVPSSVVGEVTGVRQILKNLLSNAVKFTEKGKIIIHVGLKSFIDEKYEVCFAVEDSGIGLDDNEVKMLFKAFSQIDMSASRHFGGTGLGLAICQKLIKMMKGKIHVESIKGKGSTFSFYVPFESADFEINETENVLDKKVIVKDKILKEEINKADLKILLAEDIELNRKVIVRILGSLGYKCEVANNGLEAFEEFKRNNYDLILMDCQMPIMDGYEATIKIREYEKNSESKITIIAMTANAMTGDKEKCLAVGMDDYLSKPILVTNLKAAIEKNFRCQARDK